MNNKELIENYEEEIKLLKDEVKYVARRYYEKREIGLSFMITLERLLKDEIKRLEELVEIFKKMIK